MFHIAIIYIFILTVTKRRVRKEKLITKIQIIIYTILILKKFMTIKLAYIMLC